MVFRSLLRSLFAISSKRNSRECGSHVRRSTLDRNLRPGKRNFRHLVQLETLEDRFNPAALFSDRFLGDSLVAPEHRGIVFIDANLVNQVPATELSGSQVVALDPNQDFFAQISGALNGQEGLDVVRLITHGQAGGIVLGNQFIDNAALQSHSDLVQSWGQSLAPGADFLVYGCNVGSSPSGLSFLGDLSSLTGADVAGSSDVTGAEGDLSLEVTFGAVESGLIASNSEWIDSGTSLVTITSANNTSSTYGASSNFNVTAVGVGVLTYSISGAPAGVTIDSGTGVISIATTTNAGTHNFSVQVDDAGDASKEVQAFTLNAATATLTVTANPLSKTYGDADPTLTYSFSGFVNADTSALFSGTLTRAAGETVAGGPYAISQGTLSAGSNYSISFTGANFSITTRSLSVTANALNKVYGDADPTLTYTFGTLYNGDTSTIFSGTLTRAAGETVAGGPYAISQGSLSAGSNYSISFTGANFSINTRSLSVTANALNKVYGDADPTLTYTFGTLYNGDTSTIFSGTLTRAAGETVAGGPYAISQGSLSAGSNYSISFTGANFSITAKPLTVTAKNVTGTYGSITLDGTTGFVASGLVGGETIGSVTLTTNATLSTSGNYNYSASPWTITPSAATGGTFTPSNYAITYVNGSLTVNKRALTVTATGVDRQYDGTTNATVNLSDDRVVGDVLTPTYSSAVFTTNKHVGTNKPISVTGINISGTDAGNYTFNTTAATTANITKKIIAAVDISKYSTSQVYGDPADLNPNYSGPNNQAGTTYFNTKVDVSKFSSSFQFQTKTLTKSAGDGITFIIQNAGLTARGANGEGLGYQGIGNSVAIKVDLVNNYGEGTNSVGVYTGGANPSNPAIPSTSLSPFGFFFETNHIFQIDLDYDGTELDVTVADLTSRLVHTLTYTINIPAAVGDTLTNKAYVGFGGATGALASQQSILNWSLTDGTSSKVVDYSTGFNDQTKLAFNGSAIVRGNPNNPTYPTYPLNPLTPAPIADQLILTCSNKAFDYATGIFSETLPIVLASTGNSPGADVGTYPIDGYYYDGTGLASDYDIQSFTGGLLTVGKKSITHNIVDQRQTYDSPANLNSAINSNRIENYLNQSGSVFHGTPVAVNANWTSEFTFQSKTLTSVGADGIAFVLQNKGAGALGNSGEGLGYQGIQKSVAIKFDSFNNVGEGTASTGIFYGGANPSTLSGSIDLTAHGFNFANDHLYKAALSYNQGTTTLTVVLTNLNTSATATQSYSVNLASKILSNNAYIGFTSGTGAQASEQSIKSWKFAGSHSFTFADFSNPSPLVLNGSAAWNSSSKALVMTGNNPGHFIETGVNDEHLKLTLATVGVNVGTYALTGTAADDEMQFGYSKTGAKNTSGNSGKLGNYNLTLNNGSVQIRPADLLIIAPSSTITYGDTPSFTSTAVGLKNGETLTSVTYSTNTSKSTGGFYRASDFDHLGNMKPWALIPSNAVGTFTPSNYHISYQNGDLKVAKAALSITPQSQTKTYGDTFAFTGNEITTSGLKSGDSITYVDLTSSGTNSKANFGNYNIQCAGARGDGVDNYTIIYNSLPSGFTVNKKALTVNINNKSQSVGTKAELNDKYPSNYMQQVGSFFTSSKVDISKFSTSFYFKFSKVDNNVGEGFTFTIQGNAPTALGGKNQGLGYSGILNSLCVKFDLTDNEGEGSSSTGVYVNGASPTVLGSDPVKVVSGSGIDLQDMNDCKAEISYDGSNLNLKITDLFTNKFFQKSYSGYNIPALCGSSNAYVGFTGCTGSTVKQEIKSWTFTPGSGPDVSFSSGFGTGAEPTGLTINGDAVANWTTGYITLTDQNYGQQILGANNETLFLFLTSTGNDASKPAGTYTLTYDGKIYEGTGDTSNYIITVNDGVLTVS